MYKVIVKVSAERLKKVLPRTISSPREAFLAGRQILDQVLIAKEAIEDYKLWKEKRLFLKLILRKLTTM